MNNRTSPLNLASENNDILTTCNFIGLMLNDLSQEIKQNQPQYLDTTVVKMSLQFLFLSQQNAVNTLDFKYGRFKKLFTLRNERAIEAQKNWFLKTLRTSNSKTYSTGMGPSFFPLEDVYKNTVGKPSQETKRVLLFMQQLSFDMIYSLDNLRFLFDFSHMTKHQKPEEWFISYASPAKSSSGYKLLIPPVADRHSEVLQKGLLHIDEKVKHEKLLKEFVGKEIKTWTDRGKSLFTTAVNTVTFTDATKIREDEYRKMLDKFMDDFMPELESK